MPGLHKKPGALKHHRGLPAAKAHGSTRLVLRTPWPPRGSVSGRQNALFSQRSNDRSAREGLPSPRKLPKVNGRQRRLQTHHGLENHTVEPDLNRLYGKSSVSEPPSFCPAAHPWLPHSKKYFFGVGQTHSKLSYLKRGGISPVGRLFTTTGGRLVFTGGKRRPAGRLEVRTTSNPTQPPVPKKKGK